MRPFLAIVLLVVVVMAGLWWQLDQRAARCHAKGGEEVVTYSIGALCVSPDGRILR